MENEHLPDKQTKKRTHHKKSQHKKTTTKKHSRKNMNSFVFHLTQICVLCIVLNLDAKLRTQMRMEIKELYKHSDATFVYVTHDQTEAMTLGTKIVVLNN